MLLANLYLNSQVYTGTPRWNEAMAAAQEVITSGYTLDPNWRRMFSADNNTSPEIIFAVTQDGQHTQSWGATTFLVCASIGGSMTPSNYGVDCNWWGLRMKPETYNLFQTGDKRASFFFMTNQTLTFTKKVDNWNEGIPAPKFTNMTSGGVPGSHRTHPDTDFPMFRLSDAYLIYAEAAVRANANRAQALGYINAIRDRAFGDTAHRITDTQMTLSFILAERGRELMWEAHRRTDLVRYGLFTGGTYVWTWKGDVLAGRATETYRDLYPLPANELVANPNLVQNTGY
jgi:hypothetical protein